MSRDRSPISQKQRQVRKVVYAVWPGQRIQMEARPAGVQPVGGRWGGTPWEADPADDAAKQTPKQPYRPAEDQPWREGLRRKKGQPPDSGPF